ncbi:unnamed protein product [Clonostachys rosea f. rosea IK726]|uniref:Uncharacterized protein n=1 Tax=Clonostachys rosea f. rosea IK726 TaxID=1349383 RepID=A0ACA9UCG1_BIOOC|nr:unnamed protein product [Clonostachys rosea f. rosea IK726]
MIEGNKHHDTPKKARLKGAAEFLEAKKIPYFKTDLFNYFEVPARTGYRILSEDSSRMRNHDNNKPETRQQKRKITELDLDKLEDLYEKEGFEAKALPWAAAAIEAGINEEASTRTISRQAASRQLFKRLAAEVTFTTETQAKQRFNWATEALLARPNPEDWHDVIFSDECHFGYGDEGRRYIARKSGTRSDPSNIQERREPEDQDKKRIHSWGGIGYDFKSPIVFYDSGNSNGKMTQQTYKRDILEPYVKRWIEEGRSFVLEEDGDSGHGPGKSNPVRAWKEEYGLKSYFNCPRSPDLSPIENCWLVPKQYVRKYPHWDLDTLRDLVEEGWEQLSQETINRWVESMPQRLRDVIKMEGKKTNW